MQQSIRMRWPVLIALGVCACLLAACGGGGSTTSTSGESSTSVTLKVAFQPTATALPALVAKDQGFFTAHGLDVALQPATGLISQQVNALGHQFDITMGTQPDLIRAAGNNLPVVEISGGAVDSATKPTVLLIARPNTGITKLTDLAGKRVGSPSLSGNIHLATVNAFGKAGVSNVSYVEAGVPVLPDQLKAGKVDAIECLQPYANILTQQGFVSLGDPFNSIGPSTTTNLWLANSTWANGHRKEVEAWQAALTDAATFITAHDAEARQTLQKYTQLPDAVVKTFPLPGFDFGFKQEELSTWIDVMKQSGSFSGKVDTKRLIPNWVS